VKVVILHGAFSENKHGTSSLELRWPTLRCRRKDSSKSVHGRATSHIVIFSAVHSLNTKMIVLLPSRFVTGERFEESECPFVMYLPR
jgi:hypothetical protein